MNKKTFQRFQKQFKDAIIDTHDRLGDVTAIVDKSRIREICEYLRDDERMSFTMLSDLTVVDYLKRAPRFEVVYHLYSIPHGHRLRLRVPVEEGEEVVESIHDVWKAANWAEREAWDMFGIRFDGHPDLRRILMYEEFEGHPLRKDFPIQGSQPRMDLRARERDAVEEYDTLFASRRADAGEA
jgi:NADH-quinone oxidoreductase subunit C